MTEPHPLIQPDVKLILDHDGVIREVSVADHMATEGIGQWVGRRWDETVADVGGEKVRRLMQDARQAGVAGFRQLNQRFPSGREVLMEYTAVSLGEDHRLVAIGKSLQAVAELQSRLVAAQQAMEQDYWKLRQVETRYRLLFTASTEAVLMLRAEDLTIVEANPAALSALGQADARPQQLTGHALPDYLATGDRPGLEATLARVREQGKAPATLLHLGPEKTQYLVRASLMSAEGGPLFLLQLTPADGAAAGPSPEPVNLTELLGRSPDALVVMDRNGMVLEANQAFLDLVQVGTQGSVRGERISRWLGRPGADLSILLANVRRHGVVRLFATAIHGELGTEREVEISATGDRDSDPKRLALLLRDVSRRLVHRDDSRLGALLGSLTEQIGRVSLKSLVANTVGVVERHYIEEALRLAEGNRTAAAELLGLSRQGLYAKLNRYGIDGEAAVGGAGARPRAG